MLELLNDLETVVSILPPAVKAVLELFCH